MRTGSHAGFSSKIQRERIEDQCQAAKNAEKFLAVCRSVPTQKHADGFCFVV